MGLLVREADGALLKMYVVLKEFTLALEKEGAKPGRF